MTRQLPAPSLLLLVLSFLPSPADTQIPTEFMGNPYKDDEARAADHYSRGLKALRKAESEQDPEKRTKLFGRAKKELGRAAGLAPNYDHFLALGQAHLGLGDKEEASVACSKALAYKAEGEDAKKCVEEAEGGSR
jgi:hypothetical protein